jgi:hypothetical protein
MPANSFATDLDGCLVDFWGLCSRMILERTGIDASETHE